MNNTNYIIDLLCKALRNSNNAIRKQAEGQLLKLCYEDTEMLFENCSQIIFSKSNDQFLCVSSLTLISRAVSMRNQLLWDKVSAGSKHKIKDSLLGTLINPIPSIVRAGAHAISCVLSIQLPRNQWLQFVNILAQNSQNNNQNICNASIMTIGYACQQLKYTNTNIDIKSCENFMAGIFYGLKNVNSQAVFKTSLVALRNSLPIVSPVLMNTAPLRDQVFGILLACLKKQILQQEVYEVFFEFAKTCYDFFGEHLETLMDYIIPHLRQRNYKTILALDLLDVIGSQYMQKIEQDKNRIGYSRQSHPIFNHLNKFQGLLLPQIMRCFLIQSTSDLQFAEMRNAADKTLGTMVAIGNQQTIDTVIQGVAKTSESTNPGEQQASAPLMSTLCQYQDREAAAKYINDGIEPVIKLLNTNQIVVISNTLSGFTTIAESFPYLFFNRNSIGEIVSKYLSLLHFYSQNPVITYAILDFFTNLSEGFVEKQQNLLLSNPKLMMTSIVSQFQNILNNFHEQDPQKTQRIAITIMNFLQNINDFQLIYHMIDFLCEKTELFLSQSNSGLNLPVLRYIMSILTTALFSLSKTTPQQKLLVKICRLFDLHIEKYNVQTDQLFLIGSLCIAFESIFLNKARQYIKYIFDGIMMVDQPNIFQAAISCLGDYSRIYRKQFQYESLRALGILIEFIDQKNIQRNLKVKIIQSIGDIFIGLGAASEQFIEDILKIFNLCFEAVFELEGIPSQKQYVQELKTTLIVTYSCVAFSVFSAGSYINHSKFQIFADHYPVMLNFIKRTCDRRFNPTVDYVKSCLTLTSDASAFLMQYQKRKPIVINSMESPEIKDLISALDKFNIQDDIKELQNVMRNHI